MDLVLGRFHNRPSRAWPLCDRSMWCIVGALIVISLLHYLTDIHLIPYHSIYRSLYYVPIAVGAVRYGRKGGIASALAASALYLPHVVCSWGVMPSDAFNDLLENVIFLFVGAFAGSLADAERTQRQRAQESAQQLATSNNALTQQVDLSERMRGLVTSVLDSIDSGVLTIDQMGRVSMINPAGRAVLGAFVEHTDDLPPVVRRYLRQDERSYEVAVLNKRTYGLHAAPLIGARQEPIGTVLVLDDVTEQRALEEQVQRAQRLAALGRLAGGLAHEIRNPLAIVRASAQMLHQQIGTQPVYAEYTQVIQTEIDRVDRLVEQLLTYARPTVMHRAPIDIGALIERTFSLVHPYATQQHVHLTIDSADKLPTIDGDSELLHQALVNLMLNAIQATPPGGQVAVTGRVKNNRHSVQIMIADTGCGIQPIDVPKIFDPFFTTRDDGTGLGLSIVQQIVQEHGGTVEVYSELGHGTQVVLDLPRGAEASLEPLLVGALRHIC